jgi:hypothetical protein
LARKTKKKAEDVEAYKHKAETRKNAVPVGLASYDTTKLKPKKYECDPHLNGCPSRSHRRFQRNQKV